MNRLMTHLAIIAYIACVHQAKAVQVYDQTPREGQWASFSMKWEGYTKAPYAHVRLPDPGSRKIRVDLRIRDRNTGKTFKAQGGGRVDGALSCRMCLGPRHGQADGYEWESYENGVNVLRIWKSSRYLRFELGARNKSYVVDVRWRYENQENSARSETTRSQNMQTRAVPRMHHSTQPTLVACPACGGRGWIASQLSGRRLRCIPCQSHGTVFQCPVCQGRGGDCSGCNGSGLMRR